MAKQPASQSLDPKVIDKVTSKGDFYDNPKLVAKVLDDERESQEVNMPDSESQGKQDNGNDDDLGKLIPDVNINMPDTVTVKHGAVEQPLTVKLIVHKHKPKRERKEVPTKQVAVWLIWVVALLATAIVVAALTVGLANRPYTTTAPQATAIPETINRELVQALNSLNAKATVNHELLQATQELKANLATVTVNDELLQGINRLNAFLANIAKATADW